MGRRRAAFTGTGAVLVRAPALPRAAAPGPSTKDLRGYAESLAARCALREAIAVASPSLAAALERGIRETDLPRLATGLTGYALRMSHRPTPSGLLAGVRLATVGDTARARIGGAHRRHARPDATWLLPLAARLAREPGVLATSVLVADNTVTRRGDELVLGRTTIKAEPAVEAVLRAAATPVPYRRLADPQCLVPRLVELGFLHTDLVPPPDAPDPFAHLIDRLGAHPLAAELREIAVRLRIGAPDVAGLAGRMRAIQPADRPIHLDLVLDADVRLPRSVVDEAAAAAEALWRMSAPDPPSAYHRLFLERYGLRQVVPLTELLAPAGLGPPVAPPRAAPRFPPARRRLLAHLVHTAVAGGHREVVLDADAVEALSLRPPDAEPPEAVELYAVLRAGSTAALDAGDFRLAIGPSLGTRRLGASFGRFAHLLGAAALPPLPETAAIRAALVCRPARDEAANVAAVPDWSSHTIRIGVGPAVTGARQIPLSALGVSATAGRLRLVHLDTGRDVLPTRFDMLSREALATPAARLLDDLAGGHLGALHGWDWAELGDAPFLPRIRLGRTVLSPARWTLGPALTGAAARDEPAWLDRFAGWREIVRLPGTALLASDGDQYLPLDLDDPLHLAMLRRACAGQAAPYLLEVPGGEDHPDGWLGGHTAELVVPLIGRRTAARPADPRPVPVTTRALLPGGEWLYARLEVPRPAQVPVLRDHLPALVAALGADRWHFVRYADPRPQLRLRFRTPTGLPVLHDWVEALRAVGLAGDLTIDTYHPEVDRYGGPDAFDAAERAFTADSAAVLAMVRAAPVGADPLLVAAAGVVDLVRSLGHPAITAGWAARPVDPAGRAAFTARRRDAVSLVDPADDWAALRAVPGGTAVVAAWERRRPALAELGRALLATGAGWSRPAEVAASLVHLHCNRRFGTDPAVEPAVVSIARGALRAHADRARHHR